MDLLCFFLSCVFVRVCLYVFCGHLLGKGWPLGSHLWCLTVNLSLSHWYPGSGVLLDCIDSWSLHPYLLCNWDLRIFELLAPPQGPRRLLHVGLARLIKISVNWSIYNRKTIIAMKIKKSVTFNSSSVRLFNQNWSVIASCDVSFRREVPWGKQSVGINCCDEVIKTYSTG